MAKLLLSLALCVVFAAAILAGPGAAARHRPTTPDVPVLTTTTTSDVSSVPVVKGSGSGRMHY
jgi:hypothetical protein